ncbi:MAG: LptF/LptG family permease [Endomicrobium sp.]|jgi:lipopolysaccharide export system permease protein|nr:LptF/LptG family permease [Endomicrobium sp.]
MIKKLHLYIIKEFFWFFFLGIMVFTIILILNLIFDLINLFLSKGISFFIILKLFTFYIPNILTVSIPTAVLFATMLAYGRLSADNEITVMKSSGIDYKTLTMPIIILVCIISFFLMFFNHFLAPALNSHFSSISEEIIIKNPLVKFNEKSIIKIGEYRLYANKINNRYNTLSGVSIYKFEQKYASKKEKIILNQNYKKSWHISASSAKVKVYSKVIRFILHQGYWQETQPLNINSMTHITFKTYVFFIPLRDVIKGGNSYRLNPINMQSPKLFKNIKIAKEHGLPFTLYERDFWLRWILGFAPIAFILVALPMAIMTEKNGKGIGFGISLGIILFYYIILTLSVNLGEQGYAPFGIIMWLPNFMFVAIGSYLFIRMLKK